MTPDRNIRGQAPNSVNRGRSPLKRIIEVVLRRYGQFFTLGRVIEITALPRGQVYRGLQRLVREGHLARYQVQMEWATGRRGRPAIESIVYRALPTLRTRKETGENHRHPNTAWDRAWKAVRVMRRFRKKDVVMTAGMKAENACFFLKSLGRAGYLRPLGRGRDAEWVLVEDPGPERPSWAEIGRRDAERRKA